MSDIKYNPDIGFFDNKTKAAIPITLEEMQALSQKLAGSYKGHPGDITVCVGIVQEGGTQKLVYTLNQNSTSPEIRAAAAKLGIERLTYEPRVAGRGTVGAPGDAEQILFEAAEANNKKVIALAPSRPACQDCASLINYKGAYYIPPPTKSKLPNPVVSKKTQSTPKSKVKSTDTKQQKKPESLDRGIKEGKPESLKFDNGTQNRLKSGSVKAKDVRASLKILSTGSKALIKVTPTLIKIYDLTSKLNSFLSTYESIEKGIANIYIQEKSEEEKYLQSIYNNFLEINNDAKEKLDSLLSNELAIAFDDILDSNDHLLMSQVSIFNDFQRYSSELIGKLESYNDNINSKINQFEFLISKIQKYQDAIITLSYLQTKVTSSGLEYIMLKDKCIKLKNLLIPISKLNIETIKILDNIKVEAKEMENILGKEITIIAKDFKGTGKGWAVHN